MTNLKDIEHKIVKYHKKYATSTNLNKVKLYEHKLKLYDSLFINNSQFGGNINNKKYMSIKVNRQVYQLLGIKPNTFNINSIFSSYGISQKPSQYMHTTVLTFDIDPSIEHIVQKTFNLEGQLTLTPTTPLLRPLPVIEPKFITVNYKESVGNLLNITNNSEQVLVDSVRNVMRNITLLKIQVDGNNIVNYAYNIDDSNPNIKNTENTSPRYHIQPFNITLIPLTFPTVPAVELAHRYFAYGVDGWKEVLTVFHYGLRSTNDPRTGTMHVSISNRNDDPNKVVGLHNDLVTHINHYKPEPISMHFDHVTVGW